ncbi:MAG: transcriptional repressor [Gammaproteobacteria bacterium]|nr:transcriptional repressor [Gammaproteobacteria bacterium]MYD76636.1 transcriptional repressor [Gammaproteobacteria bacterium]MYJ53166.1 transcriptional repressor [Gammaproteobacteria bacterium]
MAKPPTRPKPCIDTDCRGQHSSRERVALAVSMCKKRGVQMTTLRRRVLELLWSIGRPAGAYELIEAVRLEDSRPVGPPTVYRTLEFLMEQGLVSKIESLNAYVPCVHPERDHDCLFFICSGCRASVEHEDSRIGELLAEDAAAHGFVATRRTIEVEGVCARCAEVGAA